MKIDEEKFYDRETRILNSNSLDTIELETITQNLMQFVKNNYDFIVENTDDWYDTSYDMDLIEQIPSLKMLGSSKQQRYIQALLRYDNSGELLLSRYSWMIGLTRIVFYDSNVLEYETKRLDDLASIFDDSIPEDLNKVSELITSSALYEKIIFEKASFLSDRAALKMVKEEMIEIYDSEDKSVIIN